MRGVASTVGVIISMLPAAAPAYCPVSDDLDSGVEILFEDGHLSVYRRGDDGILHEKEVQADGSSFNYLSENGVLETGYYELVEEDGDPQGWESFSYSFDLSRVLPLTPWSGQSGYRTAAARDGGETKRSLFGYRTGAEDWLEIGDCRYRSIRLETFYAAAGDGFRSVGFAYLPELAVPVTMSFADGSGSGNWRPVKIRLRGSQGSTSPEQSRRK